MVAAMEVREALLGRRTIHRYRPEPIPEGAVERALQAAICAPNHRLTFPWRFTRVGDASRERLATLAVSLKEKPEAPLTDAQIAAIRSKILNPAELIVVSVVRHENPDIAREDYASAACAIQNIKLALWAEGVGTKWSSGKLTVHPQSYATCGIDSGTEEIVAYLWAGIAETIPETPARPALSSFVRNRD